MSTKCCCFSALTLTLLHVLLVCHRQSTTSTMPHQTKCPRITKPQTRTSTPCPSSPGLSVWWRRWGFFCHCTCSVAADSLLRAFQAWRHQDVEVHDRCTFLSLLHAVERKSKEYKEGQTQVYPTATVRNACCFQVHVSGRSMIVLQHIIMWPLLFVAYLNWMYKSVGHLLYQPDISSKQRRCATRFGNISLCLTFGIRSLLVGKMVLISQDVSRPYVSFCLHTQGWAKCNCFPPCLAACQHLRCPWLHVASSCLLAHCTHRLRLLDLLHLRPGDRMLQCARTCFCQCCVFLCVTRGKRCKQRYNFGTAVAGISLQLRGYLRAWLCVNVCMCAGSLKWVYVCPYECVFVCVWACTCARVNIFKKDLEGLCFFTLVWTAWLVW